MKGRSKQRSVKDAPIVEMGAIHHKSAPKLEDVDGIKTKKRLDKRSRGGKLTSKERKSLPKSDFVFPSDRKYPIEDKNHARNALARVSQFGSESEKKKVRGAVHRKYPSIGD